MRRIIVTVSVAFALLTGSAQAAVSNGHSGWTWGNPQPQGNSISGLDFLGNRGYAAGTFGTLLRSDDAGATWAGINTGIIAELARIRIIDADSVVIAGGCALRRSDNAGQSFTRLPWTASDLNCPSPIVSFSFPTEQVGYLLIANGTVFSTADGGKTWTRKTALPGTPPTGGSAASADIFFTTAGTGVAVAGSSIFRTADGGGSWTLVQGAGAPFNGLTFVGDTGYAVGAGGAFFRTIDDGLTWADRSTSGANLTSIRCASAVVCLAAVQSGDRLIRTVDGGDSYSSVTPSTAGILAAAFASPTRAVAAGAAGTMVASDDAGATWAPIGGRLVADLRRLRVASPTLAFAAGRDGALARTTDGGNSWSLLGVSTSGDVVDASFVSQVLGYALDSSGSVLKTDNAAASWQILNTGTTARQSAIFASGERVLLFGRGVRRSTNGGGEFSAVRGKAVSRARLSDYDRAGSSIFTWGPADLLVSTNSGKSWKKVRKPSRARLQDVDFVSSRRGFALTIDGRVWQTSNRGRRWTELLGVGTRNGNSLAFVSSRSGYLGMELFASTGAAWILRTTDAGRTWRPQLVHNFGIRSSDGLVALQGSSALALTSDSALFATSSGGDAGSPTTLTLKTGRRVLRKRGTIRVTGRLKPAEGGERVVVAALGGGYSNWDEDRVTVASNGTFTTTWKVRGTTRFVAQWAGDDDRAGDGSKVLTVRVRRR